MSINLTNPQKKFREGITWLLHPHAIGGGRSFLLAIIWIDIAKNFVGEWIRVWDHRPREANIDHLIRQILSIEPNMEVNWQGKTIRWNGDRVPITYKPHGVVKHLQDRKNEY